MVTIIVIAINHVMGVYLMPVIDNLVNVQIHLAANLEGSLDGKIVI